MQSPEVCLSGVATAIPPYALPQEQAKELARKLFHDVKGVERLLKVFTNSGVSCRHLAMPPEWYLTPRTFPEKNSVWERVALELAMSASRQALENAGVAPQEVGTVLLASTTGLATPSLDSYLIKQLELPRDTARLPVWGLGCAGGVASLARGAELVRARGAPVLVVAVELCSVTLIAEDLSKTNLVGTSLFADGAAAVVLTRGGAGPRFLGSFSHLFDRSEGIVAWDLVPEGLKVRLARSTPEIVHERLRGVLEQGLRGVEVDLDAVRHFALHPGGARVLDAYQKALDLPEEVLEPSRSVLRDHGNMSSPTALFALQRILETTPPTHQPGLLLAPGPGFSVEGVAFAW